MLKELKIKIDEKIFKKLVKISTLKKQDLKKIILDDLKNLISYYEGELNSLGLKL